MFKIFIANNAEVALVIIIIFIYHSNCIQNVPKKSMHLAFSLELKGKMFGHLEIVFLEEELFQTL